MSNWNDRNVWQYQARQAIQEFGARDITLPGNVIAAVKVWDRVTAAKPAKPAPTAIRELIVAGAPQDDIDRLLVADATWTKLNSEWTQAAIDSAGAVLAAIRSSADKLMPPLREQADAAIAKLSAIAELQISLDALVRAGRAADAALLADRDVTASELENLFRLRDQYLTRGGGAALNVNGVNCSRWRDPEVAAEHARGKSIADQYLSGLSAGCELYFPAPEEAVAAAQVIADRRATAQKLKAASEFGTGSTVFMGA